jgi:hypothetical protein
VQHATHPDGERQRQKACNDEVGDLNPAQVAEAQQAEWVTAKIEALAGGYLKASHEYEERPRHHPTSQQRPGSFT